jgi:Family of unknown function (DUF6527)
MMPPDIPFKHEFVEYVPAEPEAGTLYVSIPFATAVHKCACGCGQEVVTPLSPTDWQLTFDGQKVSLNPSIGNWSFPCQSHYWITRDRVRWARHMSRREIDAGRQRDRWLKERYFNSAGEVAEATVPGETSQTQGESHQSFWRRIWRYFSR